MCALHPRIAVYDAYFAQAKTTFAPQHTVPLRLSLLFQSSYHKGSTRLVLVHKQRPTQLTQNHICTTLKLTLTVILDTISSPFFKLFPRPSVLEMSLEYLRNDILLKIFRHLGLLGAIWPYRPDILSPAAPADARLETLQMRSI